MADAEYPRLQCVGCGGAFSRVAGAGRPRIRCFDCSPRVLGRVRSEKKRVRAEFCLAPGCGERIDSGDSRTMYCSAPCRTNAGNAFQRERILSARAAGVACAGCGVLFTPLHGKRQYCDEDCRTTAGYRRKPGSTHRRRAKKFGCDYRAVDKVKVFERDGWRCRLCGASTPRRLKGSRNDRAPELDHIVPLSLGGAHSYANTQCACKRCNLMKQNKPRGQMLLDIGGL